MKLNYKHFLRLVMLLIFTGATTITFAQTSVDEKDIFSAGIGFGGGLGGPGVSYDLLPNYSGTITPGILVSYEHAFTKKFGIGGTISYASATETANNIPYNIVDPSGHTIQSGTLTDQAKGAYIGLAAKPVYYFMNEDKYEVYGGLILGYTFTSFSSTVTTVQGSYSESSFYPGILFGALVGGKVFFTKTFGLWLEAGYCGVPDYLLNVGLCYKLKQF